MIQYDRGLHSLKLHIIHHVIGDGDITLVFLSWIPACYWQERQIPTCICFDRAGSQPTLGRLPAIASGIDIVKLQVMGLVVPNPHGTGSSGLRRLVPYFVRHTSYHLLGNLVLLKMCFFLFIYIYIHKWCSFVC